MRDWSALVVIQVPMLKLYYNQYWGMKVGVFSVYIVSVRC
jgi:hypothetical protein